MATTTVTALPEALSGKTGVIPAEWMDLTNLQVLFFHEDRNQIKHYLSILRVCGLREIAIADQLSKAVDAIVSRKIDLIIVVHNGAAVGVTRLLEELKGLDATASIPIIAIIADLGVKEALKVLAKGVDEILVEPLSRHAVERMVQQILHSQSELDPVKEKIAKAAELAELGHLEKAQGVYLELLKQGHRHLEVYLGLAQLNCRMQQWLDADNHIRKALEMAKACKEKIKAHRQLSSVFYHYGHIYEKRHRIEQAIKSYRISLSLDPFCIQSIKALLNLLQKRDEVNEILNVIKEVRRNFVPFSHASEEIALCVHDLAQRFLGLNMPSQAKRLYEQLIAVRHENTAIHLDVADFFIQQGQVSLVLKSLLEVSQRIKDPDLLYKVGCILLDMENRFIRNGKADGVEHIDLSFFKNLDSSQVILMAQKAFQEGLLLEPDNPRFRLRLACCHLRRNEHDTSAEILAKLKDNFKGDPDILGEVVRLLIEERAYNLAGNWLKDVSAAFPQDSRLQGLYAQYYQSQGKPYEAIGCLKRGLTISPENTEFLMMLAEMYQELQQYSDAIFYYERVGKLLPNDSRVQEGLQKALAMKYRKEKSKK